MLDCKRHLYHHNPVVPAYFYIQSYSVLFTEEQRNTKLRNQRIDLLLQALLLFLLLDQRRMPLALLGNDRFAGVFETDKFFLFHLLIELGRAALGRLERTRVREVVRDRPLLRLGKRRRRVRGEQREEVLVRVVEHDLVVTAMRARAPSSSRRRAVGSRARR